MSDTPRNIKISDSNMSIVSWLTTQRTMLIVSLSCGALFVILSQFDKVLGSLSLKNALLGLVSALMGAGVVGLLWEYGSRRSFSFEMQQSFNAMLESLARQASIATMVESEGLLSLTTDFHYGISWSTFIQDANEIDICWWAGDGWLQQNYPILESQVRSRSLTVRCVLPDISDEVTLHQMELASGLSRAELETATRRAKDLMRELGPQVKLFEMKRVPRYGYIRLGWRVVIFIYSLSAGRNKMQPTFALDSRKPIGKRIVSDFDSLMTIAQKGV